MSIIKIQNFISFVNTNILHNENNYIFIAKIIYDTIKNKR